MTSEGRVQKTMETRTTVTKVTSSSSTTVQQESTSSSLSSSSVAAAAAVTEDVVETVTEESSVQKKDRKSIKKKKARTSEKENISVVSVGVKIVGCAHDVLRKRAGPLASTHREYVGPVGFAIPGILHS